MKLPPAADIITYCILAALLAAMIVLGALTYMEWDVAFIRDHTWTFVAETAVIALIPAACFFVFHYTRGLSWAASRALVLLVGMKLVVLHILLQTSGYVGHMTRYHAAH